MDRLASCYFCGAGPDQPLETYRVVGPSTGEPTVTLCPPCRRKLDAVLGSAAAGTTDPVGESDPVAGPDAAETPANASDTADTDEHSSDEYTTGNTTTAWDASSEATGDELPPGSGRQPADDYADEAPAGGDPPEPDRAHEQTGSGAADEQTGGSATDDTASARDSETESERGGEHTGMPADEPGTADEHTGAHAGEGGQSDASVTKAEYRKVIRLLRNRDQPVERREIESLATSAYGLTAAQCATILDTALTQGHLEQRGEKLVAVEAASDE
jgi:hypothetical protein